MTGRSDQPIQFLGSAEDKGVEADGLLRIAGPLSISGSLTVQDPNYINFTSTTGADAGDALGKQIVRHPKVYGNIRPSLDFTVGNGDKLSVYGRYDYVGKRYVDVTNTTALPSYGYFSAGLTFDHGPWSLQVVGDNVTNTHGFTEGNTAGDTLTGQGTPGAIFGRPLWGRNVRFVLGLKWWSGAANAGYHPCNRYDLTRWIAEPSPVPPASSRLRAVFDRSESVWDSLGARFLIQNPCW